MILWDGGGRVSRVANTELASARANEDEEHEQHELASNNPTMSPFVVTNNPTRRPSTITGNQTKMNPACFDNLALLGTWLRLLLVAPITQLFWVARVTRVTRWRICVEFQKLPKTLKFIRKTQMIKIIFKQRSKSPSFRYIKSPSLKLECALITSRYKTECKR